MDWCWSWNSNTLVPWCKELTHWKRPWCWERLRAGGEGDDRGWDGWMASPTQWTWVWVNSGSWRWTEAWSAAVHGVAKSWTQMSNWTELISLSKRGKSERKKQNKYHILTCIWNLEKWYRWVYFQGRNRNADVENVRTRGREVRGTNWESSVAMSTPPCVKQTASEKLLTT